MNEQISQGPEEPFRDLAGGPASSGIEVLRYDKPTYVNPTAFEGQAHTARVTTSVTDVQDAEAAVWLSHNCLTAAKIRAGAAAATLRIR